MTTDPDPASDWCDCVSAVVHTPSAHAADCLRWRPPLTGPGSTDEHRARVVAHIKAQIEGAQRRHETHAQTEESTR